MKRSCELVESIIVVIVLISSVRCECPPPFVELETGCYFFSSDLTNWWDAAYSCRQHDSILAEVETVEEDTILNQKVQEFNRPFWFGGTDLAKEGRWVWESTQEHILYTGWGAGWPHNGANGNCLVYWGPPTYKWADGGCTAALSYICEKKQAQGRHGVKWKDAGECIRDSCGHLGIIFSAVGQLPVHTMCSRSRERDDECDPPFIQLATGCYFFSNQELNWWEAAESCRNTNSVLTTVETLDEDEAITTHARKLNQGSPYPYWLGAFDFGHEGRWLWESTLKPLVYTSWKILVSEAGVKYPEPDNSGGNEHCLQMVGGAHLIAEDRLKWNDAPCDHKNRYVCKRLADSKPACTVHVHASTSAFNPGISCNCPAANNVDIVTLQ